MLVKLFDVFLIVVVIYFPTLLGRYKKTEESLFWAFLISSFLSIISFFLVGSSTWNAVHFSFLTLLVSALFGMPSYLLYGINREFERGALSPLTWLVLIPFVDTMVLRKYALSAFMQTNSLHQLLAWYVQSNVIIMAIVSGVVYFFIFWRNGLEKAWWESAMAFIVALLAGYVYIKDGFFMAFLAEISFNVWRLTFATSKKS